ncbi:hypothetical protein EMIHUDRAFT_433506, partial [Emiliania huxleyi CCMP1516]|uniref:Membrane transport protein MMPL domain-containing protein n=2 Tax=Emiliania huxleyi TaxID=2903 RepID=A0A0D3KQF1_EMIH1
MGGLKGQATFESWVNFTPTWVALMHRFRHVVFTFWVMVSLLGVYHAETVVSSITSDLATIPGRWQPAYMRDSLQAADALKHKFPSLAGEKAIIRVRRVDGEFVLSDKTHAFCKSLDASVASFLPEGLLLGVDSIYNYWKPTWVSNKPPQFVKELFLTEGDSAMLVVIYLNYSYPEHLDHVVTGGGDMVTNAQLELAGPVAYSVFLGGDLTMRQDMLIAVQSDAAFVHTLTLPIATALLALYFRSLRIMLIPLLTITLSLSASLLITYGASRLLPLHYLVPVLLLCVTLATSVDYCLFFLARLKDEMQKPDGPDKPTYHQAALLLELRRAARRLQVLHKLRRQTAALDQRRRRRRRRRRAGPVRRRRRRAALRAARHWLGCLWAVDGAQPGGGDGGGGGARVCGVARVARDKVHVEPAGHFSERVPFDGLCSRAHRLVWRGPHLAVLPDARRKRGRYRLLGRVLRRGGRLSARRQRLARLAPGGCPVGDGADVPQRRVRPLDGAAGDAPVRERRLRRARAAADPEEARRGVGAGRQASLRHDVQHDNHDRLEAPKRPERRRSRRGPGQPRRAHCAAAAARGGGGRRLQERPGPARARGRALLWAAGQG